MEQEFKLPIKANVLPAIFLFLWGAVALIFAITILYGIIQSARYYLSFMVPCLFIASFLACNLAIWKMKGIEILLVNSTGLHLRRSGTYFKRKQIISYHELESVDFNPVDKTPGWIKAYNVSGGKISIAYLGRTVRIGQSLTDEEAQHTVHDINAAITTLRQ